MFKKLILVLSFAGLISACSSDSTSVVILPDGTPVEIVTVSGVMHSLNGTYISLCNELGANESRSDTLWVNDETWKNTAEIYTTDNCTGTAAVSTLTATMVKGDVTAITGWVDDTAPAPAPLAQDGSALSNNEAVTKIELTVTEVTGTQFSPTKVGDMFTIFYVADDTADPVTGHNTYLYRDDDAGVNSDASTVNPFFK